MMSIEEEQKMDWEHAVGELEHGREKEEKEKEDGGDANVFVKYLPAEINDADLRLLFASCGEIVSAKVMKDGSSGSSLGFGFVRFKSPYGAQRAVKCMNGIRITNKALLCKLATPAICPQPSTNLYIKPLPYDFTEEQLEKVFSRFGPILTSKILTDKHTGESKEIGFVKFAHQESATAAMEKMNGFKLAMHSPCLIVKYAESDLQRVTRQARIQPPHKNNRSPPSPQYSEVPVSMPPAYYPFVPCVPYPVIGYYYFPAPCEHNSPTYGYPELLQ